MACPYADCKQELDQAPVVMIDERSKQPVGEGPKNKMQQTKIMGVRRVRR